MSFEIRTEGSCSDGNGMWSYTIKYGDQRSNLEEVHSDSGEESGTTDVQMKLMAILKALNYIRSIEATEPIILRSDCALCIKCITKEFDCTSAYRFKRHKVTRGFVQYLQEIWWKIAGMNVRFETMDSPVA